MSEILICLIFFPSFVVSTSAFLACEPLTQLIYFSYKLKISYIYYFYFAEISVALLFNTNSPFLGVLTLFLSLASYDKNYKQKRLVILSFGPSP